MDPNFFLQPSLTLAPKLLGTIFSFASPDGFISGKIVEVEAYHQNDPASHTFRGESTRNRSMFQAGGRLYVYRIYGLHVCVNIVAGPRESGEGILLRAVEPLEGIDIMRKNRFQGRLPAKESPSTPKGVSLSGSLLQLCSGPAKLTQAFGIKHQHDGLVLGESPFSLSQAEVLPAEQIVQTTRIGISKASQELARFYIRDNPFISRT